MGKIVVIGTPEGQPAVGGTILTSSQIWALDRKSLDQAVNVVPGVVSTFDSNGRRNESDIFVRGFGRWQVPLMVDGVRIYLPADNRLDYARFLTADIAEVQIEKGYASALAGPGAMGGAINLVTRQPIKPFEVEGSLWTGGRSDAEGWNGYAMVGTRQRLFYAQASASYSDRDYWSLSEDYTPSLNSLQPAGKRLSSDTSDSRYNVKAGWTPNDTDEYAVNVIKQLGKKLRLMEGFASLESARSMVTRTGSRSDLRTMRSIRGGMVAENSIVCRSVGSAPRIASRSSANPMSSISSASSSTTVRTLSRSSEPRPT